MSHVICSYFRLKKEIVWCVDYGIPLRKLLGAKGEWKEDEVIHDSLYMIIGACDKGQYAGRVFIDEFVSEADVKKSLIRKRTEHQDAKDKTQQTKYKLTKTAAYAGGAIITGITGSRMRGASGKIDDSINKAFGVDAGALAYDEAEYLEHYLPIRGSNRIAHCQYLPDKWIFSGKRDGKRKFFRGLPANYGRTCNEKCCVTYQVTEDHFYILEFYSSNEARQFWTELANYGFV